MLLVFKNIHFDRLCKSKNTMHTICTTRILEWSSLDLKCIKNENCVVTNVLRYKEDNELGRDDWKIYHAMVDYAKLSGMLGDEP